MTTFGDMVFEFGGAPVSGARFSNPWSTHWFVDGDNGNDDYSGKKPTDAFATIGQAISAATGQDVIYIRPKSYTLGTGFARYTEDVTITQGGTGTGTTATNANISLIGVTQRRAAPTDFSGVRWKMNSATNLTVQAPGTHIENIGFFNEDGTYMVHFQCTTTRVYGGGDGSSMYNCACKGNTPVYCNGGDGLHIVNCLFQAKYDGTVGGINLCGSGAGSGTAVARPLIRDCVFIGGNAYNMATGPVILTGSIYDITLRDCYFSGATVDTGDYIVITGVVDGGVYNCYFASTDAATDLAALADGSYGIWGAGIHDANGEIDLQS